MSTIDSLMVPARKQAHLLSLREQCRVNIFTGIKNGLPCVWVRPEADGSPTNADSPTIMQETWDRGFAAGGLVEAPRDRFFGQPL